jgi:hypothetical protein
MLLTFRAQGSNECVTTAERPDGVVVGLPPAGRKWRVPHDMGHAATEMALGLRDGIFGTIAAGGMFGGMTVLEGKPRHDAAARSERLLKANSSSLGDAELLAGVIHHSVEKESEQSPWEWFQRTWASRHAEPLPWTLDDVTAAQDLLRELERKWRKHGREGVELEFPKELVSEVPLAPKPGKHTPRSQR